MTGHLSNRRETLHTILRFCLINSNEQNEDIEINWITNLGISRSEQNRFEEAFEDAIKLYPEFSDAQFYQGLSLRK